MDQVALLKKMSGEKRLEQAIMLSDFTRKLAIEGIKSELGPKATKSQILFRLKQRLWPH